MKNFFKDQRLLVISPHSDDDIFGCGGTIARVKAEGGEAFVMLLSVGDLKQPLAKPALVTKEKRIQEFKKAINYLHVDDFDIIYKDDYLHLRLDTVPKRELIYTIESKSKVSIKKIKPTIIALPWISYNQDHEAVFRAGFAACRPQLNFPKLVLAYDSPIHFWSTQDQKFQPNFYVDISKFLNKKVQAFKFHKSQIRQGNHYLSLENLEDLARVNGRAINSKAAEAFMCFRFAV